MTGANWQFDVGSRTLTTQDTPVPDSAQLLPITAESASDTSEKRIGTLRRMASLRAWFSPASIDDAVLRTCVLRIHAPTLGPAPTSSSARMTIVTASSISVMPRMRRLAMALAFAALDEPAAFGHDGALELRRRAGVVVIDRVDVADRAPAAAGGRDRVALPAAVSAQL